MASDIEKAIVEQTKFEYQTPQQVVDSLTQLEDIFRSTKDNRGIFVVAYREMTERLQRVIHHSENVGDEEFNDNHWIETYLLGFANLYRQALYGSTQGVRIPASWQIAFEKADDDRGVISLQHLMLGINAHIAHDLPITIYEAGIGLDEVQKKRKEDHETVNNILKEATNRIQNKVTNYHFSQGFSVLEKVLGPFDEWITQFYFEQQRERAWYNALHLTHLSQTVPIGDHLKEWFIWALQTEQTIADFNDLWQQIDFRASDIANVIIRWKLPKIPGFKDDVLIDEFEETLTETEFKQLGQEIGVWAQTGQTTDWTQVI